jgi:hypothetical protein
MKRNIILLTACAILGLFIGCATAPSVERISDFKPESDTFVFINSTRYDSKLRRALAKEGFTVLRFASREKVVAEGNRGEIARMYNEAEARYGITFDWEVVDRCVYNSSLLINGSMEISDIRTNEVLLYLDAGGWTGPCADPRSNVFETLSEMLKAEWKK